uniref:Sorting nexin 11 n=1 Tax=Bos taurus TaxID=9913 RepID=A0AAA9TGZ9_BOVIN
MGFWCRMLENQEQEEVITVRVQDPRVQNEGSWNSYVDYKIFLHTNSKAFTAKTSCVRRRYREFVWLRKQLQRNAGLVPVPELPGKSTFFGSSDEFIEKRRQGLQHFLEKVLQSVVLLSDSQLHLFLQSQLSVPEIEACVQGRSPVSVSDAILRYAMSNCGWAQEERRGSSHLAEGDQPKSSSLQGTVVSCCSDQVGIGLTSVAAGEVTQEDNHFALSNGWIWSWKAGTSNLKIDKLGPFMLKMMKRATFVGDSAPDSEQSQFASFRSGETGSTSTSKGGNKGPDTAGREV